MNARLRKRIVLATMGSLGDLHPFIAIALQLKERGYEPVIATGPHLREHVVAEVGREDGAANAARIVDLFLQRTSEC